MRIKNGTCPSCKQTVDYFSGQAIISGEGFCYPQHLELPRRHLCNCGSGKPCHEGVKQTGETWCSCQDIVGVSCSPEDEEP